MNKSKLAYLILDAVENNRPLDQEITMELVHRANINRSFLGYEIVKVVEEILAQDQKELVEDLEYQIEYLKNDIDNLEDRIEELEDKNHDLKRELEDLLMGQ